VASFQIGAAVFLRDWRAFAECHTNFHCSDRNHQQIASTSSSIEPLFALAYQRQHVLGGQTLTELNPLFLRHLERLGHDSKKLPESVASTGWLGDGSEVNADIRQLRLHRDAEEAELGPSQGSILLWRYRRNNISEFRRPSRDTSIMQFPRPSICRLKLPRRTWPPLTGWRTAWAARG
jgi:hypothetical protein